MMWIRPFHLLLLFLISGRSEPLPRPPHDREVVCFIYHRVGDSRYPSTNVSTDDFRTHLEFFKQHQYRVMSLGQAIEYLMQPGEYEKVAVITVDDGYESFYRNGLPLLRTYGFPATLFLNTETVGGASYMDWAEIRECVSAGVEIGNHTHSHAYFLNLDEAERYDSFREELDISQEIFQKELNIRPDLFAYPFGEFDPEMMEIVREQGFSAAVAQNSGVMHSESNFYSLPRFPMAAAFAAPDQFASKARMRALKVRNETPESFLLPDRNHSPLLEIAFLKKNLLPSSIQCFVQGGKCELKVEEAEDTIIARVSSTLPLRARRSLYTITVKDDEGHWHWFSHLWIAPFFRE